MPRGLLLSDTPSCTLSCHGACRRKSTAPRLSRMKSGNAFSASGRGSLTRACYFCFAATVGAPGNCKGPGAGMSIRFELARLAALLLPWIVACAGEGTGASFNEALQNGELARRRHSTSAETTTQSPPGSFSDALLKANRPMRSKEPGALSTKDRGSDVPQQVDPKPLYSADQVVIEFPSWLKDALDEVERRRVPTSPPPCDEPQPVVGLGALAAAQRSIVYCCIHGTHDRSSCGTNLRCTERRRCSHLIENESGWTPTHTDIELAEVLGSVRSASEAIGRVALQKQFLLTKPGAFPTFEESDRRPRVLNVVAPQVTRVDGGFLVEVLQTNTYGCWPQIYLLKVHVDTAGNIRDIEKKLLIDTKGRLCIDR